MPTPPSPLLPQIPKSARLGLLFVCALIGLSAGAATEPAARHITVPAGNAEETLERFAATARVPVVYVVEEVRGIRTNAIDGTYRPAAALAGMIERTGLLMAQDAGNGALIVKREHASKPVETPSVSPGPAHGEEVYALSPFEVVADTRGYHSANTMSGTRMNSRLEDLGSAISVVTKQQMEDLALIDVNDIFNYEASTEGAGNFTDFSFDRAGNPVDNTQLSPNTANRIRGVGAANVTFGTFETTGATPIDPIDIDAVEISRGPNSNIFGIGSAAGTVNTVRASANLRNDKTKLAARVDSFSGFRNSLDFNRVLKKDVLAVRGSAVFQREGFKLKPSGINTERYNGMVKYQPFRRTQLSASYAYYHAYGNRPNTTPPRDGITGWLQAGSPTWNPVTAQATINGVPGQAQPAVLRVFPSASLLMSVDQSGITYLTPWRSTTASSPVTMNGSRSLLMADRTSFIDNQSLIQDYPTVTSKGIYDWSSVNLAALNFTDTRSQITQVLLDQEFFRTERQLLAVQAGWFRENVRRYARNIYGPRVANTFGVSVLQIDVNERRLDGSPNPDFLRPFINIAGPQYGTTTDDRDTYRLQAAYQLDLTKEKGFLRWLGRHQLSAYLEYKDFVTKVRTYRDAIISDHAWLSRGVTRGTDGAFGGLPAGTRFTQANYRFYVGDAGTNLDYPIPDYKLGTYPLNWGNAATGVFVQEPTILGPAVSGPTGGTANQWTVLRTQGGVLQSHFLGSRIVTTFGLRHDARYTKDGALALLNSDGVTIDEGSFNSWVADWNLGEGDTRTAGVVVKPFQWLSAYVNKSDSFRPAPPRNNLYREPLADPTGEGKDYGLMLKLIEGKLYARLNFYTTKELNTRAGQAGVIGTRVLIMDRPEVPGQNGAPPTFQLQAKATQWVQAAAAANGETLTQAQTLGRVAGIMKVETSFFDPLSAIASTSNVTAKGKELEINYNPTPHWTMKLNVAEQKSIADSIAPDVIRWIQERLPVWQAIIDPTINRPWFTERYDNQTSASQYLAGTVMAPLQLEIALEGLSRPQVRKYRANFLTNYQLAGLSDNRWLKKFNVGGAIRWEDRGAIGFYGVEQLPAEILTYDPGRPIWDKAHHYLDAFVGFRTPLFGRKVNAVFQLNVRNLTEGGRLQSIAADPNGSISAYRIVNPRQFILSASFDL